MIQKRLHVFCAGHCVSRKQRKITGVYLLDRKEATYRNNLLLITFKSCANQDNAAYGSEKVKILLMISESTYR